MSTSNRLFPLDLGQLFGAAAFRVEEYTDGDAYVVRAEVPGANPDKDITVSVLGERLTIRVERAEERGDKTHSEFHYGSSARSVQLPRNALEEGVTASYAAGILTVRVPLAGAPQPGRSIPVTVEP